MPKTYETISPLGGGTMNENNKLSVTKMRNERQIFEAVYMQFTEHRKYFSSHAFCFYEGEDGKYYNARIKRKIDNIITFSVKNKVGVLNLLKKIRQTNSYNDVCMMFFVDRDCDEGRNLQDEDLYETPCYSIENLYINKQCLIDILQSEFGINAVEPDGIKCLECFELREKEFNDLILEFNSLVYLRKLKNISNSKCSFRSIKTSYLAKIKLDSINQSSRYTETIEKIKKDLDAKPEEIEDAKSRLMKKGNYSLNFRGKNQLDFFVNFIIELKQANNDGNYFSFKHNCVNIEPRNNPLSQLSQYAITPSCLSIFIDKHQERLLSHNFTSNAPFPRCG